MGFCMFDAFQQYFVGHDQSARPMHAKLQSVPKPNAMQRFPVSNVDTASGRMTLRWHNFRKLHENL